MKELNYGPVIGTIIAIAGMLFTFVMGYLVGYCDARKSR